MTGERRYGLHFHLPTGRSLLRARDATQAESDDPSKFRQTVLDVHAGVRPTVAGIEVGRTGLAIRGVVPVNDADGRWLGSAEMVADFAPLVHADEDTQMAASLNAEELRTATALADASRNPRVGDDFVLVKATAPEVLSPLMTEPLLEAARRGPVHEYHRGLVVTAWPFEDHAGRQVAVLVRVQDIQEKFAAIADLRKTMAVIEASLLAALGVAIFFVRRSATGPLRAAGVRGRRTRGDRSAARRQQRGTRGQCGGGRVAVRVHAGAGGEVSGGGLMSRRAVTPAVGGFAPLEP